MKFYSLKAIALLIALSAMASTAVAAELTLDQGPLFLPNYDHGGMGHGRGLGFHADENFSMTTFAIDLSVPAAEAVPEYLFEIFTSSDGHTAGGLLASTTFFLMETEGYQSQPFIFDFVAGNFYVINFSRVDNSHLAQLGTHYSRESGFIPYDYGILTLIEGFEGASPDPSNSLIPHVKFNGPVMSLSTTPVPTMSAWALIVLTTLLGLAVFARKRRLS